MPLPLPLGSCNVRRGSHRPVARAARPNRDIRLGNSVALKQTFAQDQWLRQAFEREARLLANLQHPALPVVSDHFVEADGQFLVMQFIEGENLSQALASRGKPFELQQVLGWADRLLDVLEYLHERTPPIIHRDLKPQNLKLNPRGEIMLLDFGLAKGNSADQSVGEQAKSLFGYTPRYAPLEQVQGTGTDQRSDLYSLAATLYEFLSGSPPPDALERASANVRGLSDPLVPLAQVNPQVPAPIAGLIEQTLALNPDRRPPSAKAMRRALHDAMPQLPFGLPVNSSGQTTLVTHALTEVAGQPVSSPPPPAYPRHTDTSPKSTQRSGLIGCGLFAIATLTMLIVGSGLWLAFLWITPVSTGETVLEPPVVIEEVLNVGDETGRTRADPLPLDATIVWDDWSIEIDEYIRGEEAWLQLARANSNNLEPGPDQEYVLLRVRVTALQNHASVNMFDRGHLYLVGSRAVGHRAFAAVPPAPIFASNNGPVAAGEVIDGWSAFLVGTEERELLLAVGNLVTNDVRYVALEPEAAFVPDPAIVDVRMTEIGRDYREPAQIGEMVATLNWQVTIEEVFRGDVAFERLVAANSFNDPPAEGFEYVLAWARVRYLGFPPEDSNKLVTKSMFLGVSGQEEVAQQSAVEPEPRIQTMLFPGGVAEGWIVVQVPINDPDARIVFREQSFGFDPDDPQVRFLAIE